MQSITITVCLKWCFSTILVTSELLATEVLSQMEEIFDLSDSEEGLLPADRLGLIVNGLSVACSCTA